jgi:hypothetical protein
VKSDKGEHIHHNVGFILSFFHNFLHCCLKSCAFFSVSHILKKWSLFPNKRKLRHNFRSAAIDFASPCAHYSNPDRPTYTGREYSSDEIGDAVKPSSATVALPDIYDPLPTQLSYTGPTHWICRSCCQWCMQLALRTANVTFWSSSNVEYWMQKWLNTMTSISAISTLRY